MFLALLRSGLAALLIAGGSGLAHAQARQPAEQPGARKPAASPEETVRKPLLDELFERLAASKDEEEANGIAGAIERVFQRSGSDTADLLLNRALTAMHRKENKTAVDVLDKLVIIEPDWAEAWVQRATARFMDDDKYGAVEDLGHALSREPRHFGALAGLGSALYSLGFERRALEVFRRALAVRPHQSEVKQMIDRLAPDVDGRDI
jgi:tetratricopeptide (TPR) repeat protein